MIKQSTVIWSVDTGKKDSCWNLRAIVQTILGRCKSVLYKLWYLSKWVLFQICTNLTYATLHLWINISQTVKLSSLHSRSHTQAQWTHTLSLTLFLSLNPDMERDIVTFFHVFLLPVFRSSNEFLGSTISSSSDNVSTLPMLHFWRFERFPKPWRSYPLESFEGNATPSSDGAM